MTPRVLSRLAEGWNRSLAGLRVRRVRRPDAWCLGLELQRGGTLGFAWKPGEVGVALCPWAWPKGAVPEILRIRLRGGRVAGIEPVPGEPILRVGIAGESRSVLVWEGVGRSSNLLLLNEDEEILWAARTLRGEFRTGAPGERYRPPPPRVPREEASTGEEGPPESVNAAISDRLMGDLRARGRRLALKGLHGARKALLRRERAVLRDLSEGGEWIALEGGAKSLMATGNLGRRGERERTVTDFGRTPPAEVTLPLDPSLTVLENAERMFRKVRKGKARLREGERLLREIRTGLLETEEGIRRVEACEDLQMLFPKAGEADAARGGTARPDLPAGVVSCPLPDGYLGFAGKNARGNDAVSFRVGRGNDFWFHARDYPGSHVVVRNPLRRSDLPPAVERAAALLAARHSRAPEGNAIEVTISQCKYLRRVPRAPGRVMVARSRIIAVEVPRS